MLQYFKKFRRYIVAFKTNMINNQPTPTPTVPNFHSRGTNGSSIFWEKEKLMISIGTEDTKIITEGTVHKKHWFTKSNNF